MYTIQRVLDFTVDRLWIVIYVEDKRLHLTNPW